LNILSILGVHLISGFCCYQNWLSRFLLSCDLSARKKKVSPFAFLLQMVAPPNVFWDPARHLHTNALHWEGFPRLLWESLRSFCYTEPPQYDVVEYQEEGVHRARVRMTIPQHPFRSQWQPIEVNMMGYQIVDTIEGAALEAIYHFCNHHPKEVAGQPIGLFSTTNPNEPEWNLREIPESHKLEGPTEEVLRGMMGVYKCTVTLSTAPTS
jgi:hypothetical protein